MGFYQAQKIEKLEARIGELEALLSQTNEGYAECIATREDYRARIAELEAALKPFAYYAEQIPDDVSDVASASGTVGDLRAARAAYLGAKDG